MKSNSLYNSKIFKFFDYVFRIVLLNLLIIIPSFLFIAIVNYFFEDATSTWSLLALIPLILYLYPSMCACVDVYRKYEMGLTKLVFKEFFKSFKKVYVKALLETLILLVVILLFYNSISFFYRSIDEGNIYIFGLLLSIAFAVMISCVVLHLPLVMNYMEGCRIIDDIKLAAIMAFKDLGITLALIITIVAIVFIDINYDTVMIICGVSLPLYLIVKLTFKKYYIVYIRTIKKRENN
jgi:uncharacterized membrane protein YesL